MPFRPDVHDELTINNITYRIAEHPAAPGMPHGQEGRAGIVYCLVETAHAVTPAPKAALKVFKPRFRLPYLVAQAEKLAALADLPGLQAARRSVLTPTRNADLLRLHPDLTYAVLMPWIEGPTWLEVLLEKKPLPTHQSLHLARSLCDTLVRMEERGIAHCDLSAPNVMLPHLAGGTGAALVDLEGIYAPDMTRPQELSSGSAGYAHKQAAGGLWGPEADRFAGAVLLAEILGWCDAQVCQAAWGESYFDPQEMQQETPRYRTLVAALERHWGNAVAYLFERAWKSDTLLDCPTFGEWLVALPEAVGGEQVAVGDEQSAVGSVQSLVGGGQVEASAEVRAFMQAARRMEDENDLNSALKLYRQALEVARGDPTLRSLAREIELTIQDVQAHARAVAHRQPQGVEPAFREESVSHDESEEPRRFREQSSSPRRRLLLLAGIAGAMLLLCLSAVFVSQNLPLIAATPTHTPTRTPTYTPTPTPTYTPTPTPTYTPTLTYTPTPTPTHTPPPPPPPPPPVTYVRWVNQHSQKCLTVESGGPHIIQRTCSGWDDPSQLWVAPAGAFPLQSKSGVCVYFTRDHAELLQTTDCANSPRWYIGVYAFGSYHQIVTGDNLCLDVDSRRTDDGAWVLWYPCYTPVRADSGNQFWQQR